MNPSSKSKFWWFAKFFLSLFLVTIAWGILMVFLLVFTASLVRTNHYYDDIFRLAFWPFATVLLLIGYTMTIYYWLQLKGAMRLLASIALGILVTGLAYIVLYAVFIMLAVVFNFTLAS